MRLSKLVGAITGEVIYQDVAWEREILSLSVDSKKTEAGALFVCLTGGERDSHEYAESAVANGAVALVVQRKLPLSVPQILVNDTRETLGRLASAFFGDPTERLKVIGITGTNGKTTTAHMLEAILKSAGKTVGIIGTLGTRYGDKEQASALTTPDPIELQQTFFHMLASGVEYVVMEVSAHALYYRKTSGVRFIACIFSNLTQDHLDFFSSMQAYREAKMRLFQGEVCPFAVVNGDDETGRMIGRLREKAGAKTLFYGLNTPSDAFVIVTDEGLRGTECMLNINDRLCRASLKLTGKHNVYNALAAAACAMELGVDAGAVSSGLNALNGVKGRLQKVGVFRFADVYVDFAHTPDGLKKSLETLKNYGKGRLVCLFGCGGNRDKAKRPIMGEVAAKLCDFSVLTSDNPRYEDPLDIIAEIEKGYRRFSLRYVVVPDRERAIDYALECLRKDDVLLIAGKGGEEYQEIMGIKYPFNDQDKVEKLLEEKGKDPL